MATTIMRAAERLGITETVLAEHSDLEIATERAATYGKTHTGMGNAEYSIDCDRQYIWLDKGKEAERRYSWLQFVTAARTVIGERAALVANSDNAVTALRDIEIRIHAHLQAAFSSVLEVGRCLIEAKNSGLVPHGQWEAWVQTHAHMSERAAQRLMQAARQVEPGSIMEGLPISKIQEILALPEPQREAMAQRAVDEDMTVKQLREAIATERRRSEQMREKFNMANDTRLKLSKALTQEQERMKQVQGQFENEKRAADEEHRREIGALRLQLEEAMAAPKGISPAAQATIDRLEAELREAEEMAEYQAELRQKTQEALAELQSRNARNAAPQEDLTAEAVITSVRTFIGCVGYLPHTKVMTLSGSERQAVAAHVEMIAEWAEGVRKALAANEPYVIEVG